MSDILKSVHKTAKGLHKSGAINKTTMRKFDAVCLTTVHERRQLTKRACVKNACSCRK